MGVQTVKSKDGKKITVTSDKFEMASQAIYDSFKQERASASQYHKFNADSPFFGYGSKDVESIQVMNGKLARANVVMAFRLWHEGMGECNNYIKSTHFDSGVSVRVKLPKVLDGEWEIDEGGIVVGGHASGNSIQPTGDEPEKTEVDHGILV